MAFPPYLKDYTSPRQARRSIADYLTFFNTERLHQSLDYQTPTEVYLQTQAALTGAG